LGESEVSLPLVTDCGRMMRFHSVPLGWSENREYSNPEAGSGISQLGKQGMGYNDTIGRFFASK